MRTLLGIACAVLMVAASSAASVTVSLPYNGMTVGPWVHYIASASSSSPITGMQIYVDNNSIYGTAANWIDVWLPLAPGTHYVVVQAWDATGAYWKAPMTLYQGTVSGSTAPVSASGTIANINQMSGWESCSTCAGGPLAAFSTTQYRVSPSLDGASQEFWIGGSTPYSNAIWWKQLGANDNAAHFVYDLWFYLVDPGAPQALEFDVNQSVGGGKFIFGTECDFRDSHQWRVWDTANGRWVPTGFGCVPPAPYSWNHLTLEFARTSGGQAMFVSLTINGWKGYVNQAFWPIPSGARELNVAFQMDGNGSQTPYSTWLDKVNLSVW